MAPSKPVSLVAFSPRPEIVHTINAPIISHGYKMYDILTCDSLSKREPAFALRVLEPPPTAIFITPTYIAQERDLAFRVLEDFLDEAGVERGAVINLTFDVLAEVRRVLEKLEGFFDAK